MAESMYQNLVANFYKNDPVSVHLCDFPQADESYIDNQLEVGMQAVLDVVVLGRASRNTANIKNRQPLSKIFVCSDLRTDLSEGLLEIAKEELNVKEIEYLDDASQFVKYIIKPQLKTLGPKYGAKLGKIRKLFETCNASEIVSVVKTGETYKTVFEGEEANALIDRLLPKVFEKDTSLQLETNMLDDGTGEAIIYLFIDDMVMNAFPNEELTENEIFSVYYELDEDGRAVSVTYSKAVDRENFKILQMVTITY
jgi:isoleucyl-tRNA synthetase